MSAVLKIGERDIDAGELISLLAQYQMLPQLAKEIIIDRAISDIVCTPEEQTSARQKFCQQHQIATEAEIQAWLDRQGMSPEQFDRPIVRDLKIEKFKQATWKPQLESYFLQRKGQLDRVVYSLIRTSDAGIAQELYFRIQEGETPFADIARQYSQGSEAQTGGLVGPVELNLLHPKMVQMLATTELGKLLPPTRIGDWFVIVRLEKYVSAQLDEAMEKRLIDELFQNWLEQQLQENVSFK